MYKYKNNIFFQHMTNGCITLSIQMGKLTFIILSLLLGSGDIHAQDVMCLSREHGVNGQRTYNIVQDKKGFVWIATRFGVDRFDGQNIDNYRFDFFNNKKSGVPIESTRLLTDRKGSVWAHTDRVIYKYNEKADTFFIQLDLNRFIKTAVFDENNVLWVGSRSFLAYTKGDLVHEIKTPLIKDLLIKKIIPYRKDGILLVSDDYIFSFDTKECLLKHLIRTEGAFTIESCIFDKKFNALWIGTQDGRMYRFMEKQGEFMKEKEIALIDFPISAITLWGKDSLLIGTEGMGLLLFDKAQNKIVSQYNQQQPLIRRINGNAVSDIWQDQSVENRIWVTTPLAGVYAIDLNSEGFKFIQHEQHNVNSLHGNLVYGIEQIQDKYMFCTENGISIWDKERNRWDLLFKNKNVLTTYKDRDGMFWVSVFSMGVYKIDRNGKIQKHFVNTDHSNSIGTNIVYAITQDKEGNMWFGGRRGPISKYNPQTGVFQHFDLLQVNKFLPLNDGTMLIACEQGVYMQRKESDKIERCSFSRKLQSNFINDMCMESDSILWLATFGSGINRCNLKTDSVRFFLIKDGIASNIVQALVHSENELWYSSDNGIGKLRTSDFAIENYHISKNKMSDWGFRQNAGFMSNNGTIFFGSYDGVVYFSPQKIIPMKERAKLYFRSFKVSNRTVKSSDENSPLHCSIDNMNDITLNHTQNSLTFDFSAIDYLSGSNKLYSWKLEGVDNNWVEPTSEHIANYTNLQPGNYTFIVRYLSSKYIVLDERKINISISPPFWNTTWARIIEVILLWGIIFYFYQKIKRKLRKKQMEERLRFFANISHNIRTPLTLIKSPINELRRVAVRTSETDYLIDLITENVDKITRLFAVYTGLHNAYVPSEKLQLSQVNITRTILSKVNFWKNKATNKGVVLEARLSPDDLIEWVDEIKFQQVLDNLISIMLEETEGDNKKVTISLIVSSNKWVISIYGSVAEKFLHRLKQSGQGLSLVRQYIILLGGLVEANRKKEGIGMTITFQRGYEHYKNYVLQGSVSEKDFIQEVDETANTDNKHQLRVLIVEENIDMGKLLQLTLRENYFVKILRNARDVWSELLNLIPDVVVIDLEAYGENQFELCRSIRTNYETSHIPIIVLSAADDNRTKREAFDNGVDDYIEKPFDLIHLRSRINNIITNRNLLRRKFLGANNIEEFVDDRDTKSNKEFILKVQGIMEKHMGESGFSIHDFSKEMNLSRTLLFSKFRTITGHTPNEFIKIIRMKKAVELLRTKQYTVNQISYMVGYEEPAYFSTCFKKIYGKSPKQFADDCDNAPNV